jgi:hypothetical protein
LPTRKAIAAATLGELAITAQVATPPASPGVGYHEPIANSQTIRNEQPGVSSGHIDTREGPVSAPTAAEPNANTAYSSNAAKFAAAYQLGLTLNDGEHDAAGEGRVDSHHYLP